MIASLEQMLADRLDAEQHRYRPRHAVTWLHRLPWMGGRLACRIIAGTGVAAARRGWPWTEIALAALTLATAVVFTVLAYTTGGAR